jgi:hypothetical protein
MSPENLEKKTWRQNVSRSIASFEERLRAKKLKQQRDKESQNNASDPIEKKDGDKGDMKSKRFRQKRRPFEDEEKAQPEWKDVKWA